MSMQKSNVSKNEVVKFYVGQKVVSPPELYRTKIFLVASSLADFEAFTKAKYKYILTSIFFRDRIFGREITNFKELFEKFGANVKDYELFLDSGSYSVTARGHKMTEEETYAYLDDYIEFIYENKAFLKYYCNFDLQFKEKIAKDSHNYLAANGLHDAIPVHHRPERLKLLTEFYNSYNSPNSFLGLSPQPTAGPNLKYEYTKRCFGLHPTARFHLFGSVDYKVCRDFNVFSADSSGASRGSSTGQIRTPVGAFNVGKKKGQMDHIYNKKKEDIERFQQYLALYNLTLNDVVEEKKGVSRLRLDLNIRFYKWLMKRIEKDKLEKGLVALPRRREILKIPWTSEYGSYHKDGVFPGKGDWK